MLVAADIARHQGRASDRGPRRAVRIITQMGPLPAVTDLSVGQVIEAVGRDKKVDRADAALRAADSIGSCEDGDDVSAGRNHDGRCAKRIGLQG